MSPYSWQERKKVYAEMLQTTLHFCESKLQAEMMSFCNIAKKMGYGDIDENIEKWPELYLLRPSKRYTSGGLLKDESFMHPTRGFWFPLDEEGRRQRVLLIEKALKKMRAY
jgi:hypothetical protein